MPRTPEQFKEIRDEKRKLIMDVALDHFANEGYFSTSISHIAQTAGISKGLMYNYFKSKEELLKSILDLLIGEILEEIDANNDKKITEDEALHFIDFYFDIIKNKREQIKLFYQLSVQPLVINFMLNSNEGSNTNEREKMILDFFLRGSKIDPEISLINLTSIIKGFSIQYVISPEKYPDELLLKYKEYLKNTYIRNKKP